MPKLQEGYVKPYIFHGVIPPGEYSGEVSSKCPFCRRDGRLSLNTGKGLWRCFHASCNEKGNVQTFLQRLHEAGQGKTPEAAYKALAANRGLLGTSGLREWGLVKSPLTGKWLIPGYRANGKLATLYAYPVHLNGRDVMAPTPTLGHHLLGVSLYNPSLPAVCLCEGLWDGIALWECVRRTANVLAVPGCNVFSEDWLPLFRDKKVFLLYDNDHPKPTDKAGSLPAGMAGMRRVASILGRGKALPGIYAVHWGDGGFDPDRPDGFDVRDLLKS